MLQRVEILSGAARRCACVVTGAARPRARTVTGALLVLVLAFPGAAAAQRPSAADSAEIAGVVLDALTRHPLPGTIVRVVNLNRQDVTHEDGAFHLGPLPHGRHTIAIERLGYRREVREVTLDRLQVLRLTVELHVSAIELPGLVVTGTVGARRGEETLRPIDAVAGQELARKLDITVAGTIEREPGMATTSMGPATARPIIRGMGGDRVLILEDGVRPGDLSSASADHALAIDPLNAHRMEVVRGPTALLYGSNAIGGVVNVIRDEVPTSLPDRATGSVTLHGESVNEAIAGGAVGTVAAGPVALRAEASLRRAGDVHTPGALLENSDLRTVNTAFGAGIARSWGNAGVSLRYFDNRYGVPPESEEEEEEGEHDHAHGVRIDMRRVAVHSKADVHGHVGPYTQFGLDASYTDYDHQELEEDGVVGSAYALRSAAVDLLARHEPLGRFLGGAIGLRLDWQSYDSGGDTDTPPARELGIAGFFLEELDVGRLRLQAGARYDWRRVEPLEVFANAGPGEVRTRTFGSISASFGGLYALTPSVQVGASLARAFRTPGIAELFSDGAHLATYSYEVGNPDLEPEVGIGLDAFVRLRTTRLNGEIAAFRNTLDNYIYYRETGVLNDEQLPIFQATGTDAVLTGLEASAEWLVLPRVVLEGVVSHVRGERETPDGRRPLPLMPPLHGELNVRYERAAYFAGAGWHGSARQERVAADEFETPTDGFGLWNALVGYRFTKLNRVHSVTLRAENLTNALYYDHLSRAKELFPGAGRNFSLVYRVVF